MAGVNQGIIIIELYTLIIYTLLKLRPLQRIDRSDSYVLPITRTLTQSYFILLIVA